MKHIEEHGGTSELQQQLAANFRKERLRLGLSPTDVAHFCGVSASSIFGWEASRSKIPLSALACLWERGFDPEAIVGGTDKFQSVRVLLEGMDFENAQSECFVPMHMLLRHGANPQSAFAYLNLAFAEDIAAPCDLVLMGGYSNQDVNDLDEEAIILFRPKMAGLSEFLCRVKPAGKGRLRVDAGGKATTIATRAMLDKGEAIGVYCYRIGFRKLDKTSSEAHSQRLSSFLKKLGS